MRVANCQMFGCEVLDVSDEFGGAISMLSVRLHQTDNDTVVITQAAQEAEGASCSCLAVFGRRLLEKRITSRLAWAIPLFEPTIRW